MSDEKISAEEFQGWCGMFSALAEVKKRGNLPKLGEVVEKNGRPHILTRINTDGSVGWTEIPKGMTENDTFPRNITLWERV